MDATFSALLAGIVPAVVALVGQDWWPKWAKQTLAIALAVALAALGVLWQHQPVTARSVAAVLMGGVGVMQAVYVAFKPVWAQLSASTQTRPGRHVRKEE